jgi:hypothetical protein
MDDAVGSVGSVPVQQLFEWGMKRIVPSIVQPLAGDGPILNLGAGNSFIAWESGWAERVVDLDLPGWDANSGQRFAGIEDGAVDGIFAFHFLEHVNRPIDVLWDCQRVLHVGAPMTIVVPYGAGSLAVHDLTHQHFFNEDTWQVLFGTSYYNGPHIGANADWKFEVGFNMICGIVERNLCLMTQLVKL